MTNPWTDIQYADLIVIMGGNAAEAHPCGFKWVTEAKENRGAKLIVVDEEVLYLGSANFTTAAFERNIEAGLRVKSPTLGKKASEHFDQWIRRGHFVALALK